MCFLSSHLFPFFLCVASHDDVQMGHLYQASPAAGASINPSHLPWSVYVYYPDGFPREPTMGRNTNVMGYPFLEGT